MEKIKPGDRVITQDDRQIRGIVEQVFEFNGIALIRSGDELVKYPTEMLEPAPEEKPFDGVPRMRSIPEVASYFRDKDPETQITERTLRQMIDEGKIPTSSVGKKTLVNLDLVIALLGAFDV